MAKPEYSNYRIYVQVYAEVLTRGGEGGIGDDGDSTSEVAATKPADVLGMEVEGGLDEGEGGGGGLLELEYTGILTHEVDWGGMEII